MRVRTSHRLVLTALASVLAGMHSAAYSAADDLEEGFRAPLDEARPRAWWHWMDGNVSQEGILLDLNWMHRVGIGGVQNFQASLHGPAVIQPALTYMAPGWRQAFSYATSLAEQFGLEMAISSTPGWSETGGPWVTPAEAMKKYVWSETRITGGKPLTVRLTSPPHTTGPFQNIPLPAGSGSPSGPSFYADAAVVAFRIPGAERALESTPKMSSSAGSLNFAALTDGDLSTPVTLPYGPDGHDAWIQWVFPTPQVVRGLSIVLATPPFTPPGTPTPKDLQVQASDDGVTFRDIVRIARAPSPQRTVAFSPVKARVLRVLFPTPPAVVLPPEVVKLFGGPSPGSRAHQIAELRWLIGGRVHRFEEKAGFATAADLSQFPTPDPGPSAVIDPSDIVDLTGKLHEDGTLEWRAPPGPWCVLRFGYTLTGRMNGPAPSEATGLEVDKLSRVHVRHYLDQYLAQYEQTLGRSHMGHQGLGYLISDSWEAGTLNWTDAMFDEFRRRRGYDLRGWLPVLAGRVVESARASDGVLWDLRLTIAELTAQAHYKEIADDLHARGMGYYSESHESGRALVADGMEVKRYADIPMSAMWTQQSGNPQTGYDMDIRESASVAHVYGKRYVAAESLTAVGNPYGYSPRLLKATADREFAMGVNRFVIHTSVHQPLDKAQSAPGVGLGPFGQWFTRNETWAEQARPWIDYLARTSQLLQQGRFVADVAWFYGEDSNITALYAERAPPIPVGYSYDFINADALVNELNVRNGEIVTSSGMNYRVLALDPRSRQMSLPVLRKIRDLVLAGARVVGGRPEQASGAMGRQAEFDQIVNTIWGPNGADMGRVHGGALSTVLAQSAILPDFVYSGAGADTAVLFVHRRLPNAEIYYINYRGDREARGEAVFRVEGRAPEIWRADSGSVEPTSYRIEEHRTRIPLVLQPNDALFVIFRKPASQSERRERASSLTRLTDVPGNWELRFPANRGAPASTHLETLQSWSRSPDPGVKYFSGTATYVRTLQAEPNWLDSGQRVLIDLGEVRELAEILVNGHSVGILWKPPFRADITDVLVRGANMLEIKVTNLWPNRMIGDKQPGANQHYTFATFDPFEANSPLLDSGLLGPVTLWALKRDTQ